MYKRPACRDSFLIEWMGGREWKTESEKEDDESKTDADQNYI